MGTRGVDQEHIDQGLLPTTNAEGTLAHVPLLVHIGSIRLNPNGSSQNGNGCVFVWLVVCLFVCSVIEGSWKRRSVTQTLTRQGPMARRIIESLRQLIGHGASCNQDSNNCE